MFGTLAYVFSRNSPSSDHHRWLIIIWCLYYTYLDPVSRIVSRRDCLRNYNTQKIVEVLIHGIYTSQFWNLERKLVSVGERWENSNEHNCHHMKGNGYHLTFLLPWLHCFQFVLLHIRIKISRGVVCRIWRTSTWLHFVKDENIRTNLLSRFSKVRPLSFYNVSPRREKHETYWMLTNWRRNKLKSRVW